MNNITLISSEVFVDEGVSGIIYINGTENPILSYNSGNNIIGILDGTSRFKPIHCSELELKLKKRGYNLFGTKFIKRNGSGPEGLTNELWYDISVGENLRVSSDSNLPKTVTTNVGPNSFYLKEPNLDHSDIRDEIQNEYNIIFGENMNSNNEVNFYSSSMSAVNLIEDLVELDLIHFGSDTYTSVLNISNIVYCNSKPGISGVFDLTVEYSKDGHIYVRDLTFPAFRYDNNNLLIENYTTEINNEIQVEYIDKTIRVNPMNSEVNECIISRCMITYGNV